MAATTATGVATLDPPFPSRRSPVFGTRGMVASTQPLACEAGLRILREGGNAADAAVAMAAALNVTEPCSTGLGGDAFALFFDASSKEVLCAMGNGRSPAALTLEAVRAAGVEGPALPPLSALTAMVPGAAAAWEDVVARWGRKSLTQVLQPAIELASGGWPVGPVTAALWRACVPALVHANSAGRAALLGARGEGPAAGELMTNHDLAATMRRLAEHGAVEGFYKGLVADAIVAAVQGAGGLMTHSDLAAHRTAFVSPISTTYRGLRVYETPPPTQGIAALIALNLLEAAGLPPPAPWSSAQRLHPMVEAMRMAFADAFAYNGDPEYVPPAAAGGEARSGGGSAEDRVPVAELLSKQYAAARWADAFSADRASPIAAGALSGDGHEAGQLQDTVYLCAVDGQGNACSFINSNYRGFGTGIVPAGCGFSLQNRGYNFVLREGHPNSIAGGKRPYHTIMPGMAVDAASGELWAAFGVMGGFMQPQGHTQVLSNMLDYGHDPQTALDAPRFLITHVDSNAGPGCVASSRFIVEEGIGEEAVAALRGLGHDVRIVSGGPAERDAFGRGQIIRRDPDSGVLWGGSDPRGDGCVMAF